MRRSASPSPTLHAPFKNGRIPTHLRHCHPSSFAMLCLPGLPTCGFRGARAAHAHMGSAVLDVDPAHGRHHGHGKRWGVRCHKTMGLPPYARNTDGHASPGAGASGPVVAKGKTGGESMGRAPHQLTGQLAYETNPTGDWVACMIQIVADPRCSARAPQSPPLTGLGCSGGGAAICRLLGNNGGMA